MFHLNLSSPKWSHAGNVSVRGYAFLPDGTMLSGKSLAIHMDVGREDVWALRLRELNGLFAVVRNADGFWRRPLTIRAFSRYTIGEGTMA